MLRSPGCRGNLAGKSSFALGIALAESLDDFRYVTGSSVEYPAFTDVCYAAHAGSDSDAQLPQTKTGVLQRGYKTGCTKFVCSSMDTLTTN